MPRRALPFLLVSVLLSGLVSVLAAAPASADDRLVLRDARGDMWRSGATGDASPAPRSTLGDIRRVSFRHGAADIVVMMWFADLRRVGAYANYTVRLQSATRQLREVTLEASPHSWAGSTRVFRHNGDVVTGCAPTHRIDYDLNMVTIVVPRSCLGTPRYVRANVNTYRADLQSTFYSDNPHDTRDHSWTWTRWLQTAAQPPAA